MTPLSGFILMTIVFVFVIFLGTVYLQKKASIETLMFVANNANSFGMACFVLYIFLSFLIWS